MQITVSNRTLIENASDQLLRALADQLTIPNPEYLNLLRLNKYPGNTRKNLEFYAANGTTISMPRGFTREAIAMAKRFGPCEIESRLRTLNDVDFTFSGSLRDYQEDAVAAVLLRCFCCLEAATGSGKTVMALAIIAERRQPALIIVHTKELAQQWVKRIERFLGIPAGEVGFVGGGRCNIGERVTVALVQSLSKCVEQVAPKIGHLVVDEAHRAGSQVYRNTIMAFDCKFMLGLSATPYRRDGLSRAIFWTLGPLVHTVDRKALVRDGNIMRAEVVRRETTFKPYHDASTEYTKMLSELVADGPRNAMIAADIAQEARSGKGVCLALSDRKEHCEALRTALSAHGIDADLLTGDLSAKKRTAVVDRIAAGHCSVLIATGALIGEGFDCPGLSTLFLATPIKFSGRVTQYVGRVLRPAPGKTAARIFDYVDVNVGVLVNAARSREQTYSR